MNSAEIEKFKQEIIKIAIQIHERLRKYGVEVIVRFIPNDNPEQYYIFVRASENWELSDEMINEFVIEVEKIGFVFVPGVNNWGFLGKIGEYPPFKL